MSAGRGGRDAVQVKVIWRRRLILPIACFFGAPCSSRFAAKAWNDAIGRCGVAQSGMRREAARSVVRARNCIVGSSRE